MANSVTQEMSASTGFKHIHEYLQEANLYSETKKGERLTNDGRRVSPTRVSKQGQMKNAAGLMYLKNRKGTYSVNTNKSGPHSSVAVTRKGGATVLYRPKNKTPDHGRGWTPSFLKTGHEPCLNTLFI